MTITDGYAADPAEVAAVLAADIDDTDRADPTLHYVRATQLSARYAAVVEALAGERAAAVLRLHEGEEGGGGRSYREVAEHLGMTFQRVQQLVSRARAARVRRAA